MTYQEARELLFKTKWKTTLCKTGEECWCRIIKPIEPILFGNSSNKEEMTICDAGSISKDFAEYFVELHNTRLRDIKAAELMNKVFLESGLKEPTLPGRL